MIKIDIPGDEPLKLCNLVLDYNGTLAEDGNLIPGVTPRLIELSHNLQIHVITADTHGTVQKRLAAIPLIVKILNSTPQDIAKQAYVKHLGCETTMAVGNGKNDKLMLRLAALGVGLIQSEGAWAATILQADIVCTHICDALDLLLHPDRLRATLRNA